MKALQRLMKSFGYASEGIRYVLKTQPNMRIHCIAAALAIAAGFFFGISKSEWLAIVIVIGFVMILEVINTAVESLVDLYTEDFNHLAKVAKDTAAGAVMLMAVVSVVVGLIIFLPKVIQLFQNFV